MKRKLTQLLEAIENISPAEFLSMTCADLNELERLSTCLADQIEMQRIWQGNEVTTIPRSQYNATAQ